MATHILAYGIGNTVGITVTVIPTYQRPKFVLGTGSSGSTGTGQIFPTGR